MTCGIFHSMYLAVLIVLKKVAKTCSHTCTHVVFCTRVVFLTIQEPKPKPNRDVYHRLTLLHIFPRFSSISCQQPALGTGYMFSRAWHRLHVFPRLAPVTCFLALATGYMFSRAWHRLHVFPRLAPVTCFLALATSCFYFEL